MLNALSLGLTINGYDKASPIFRKIGAALADVRNEAQRTQSALNGMNGRGIAQFTGKGGAASGAGRSPGFGAASFAGAGLGLGGAMQIAMPVGVGAGLLDAASAGGEFSRSLELLAVKSQATTWQLEQMRGKAIELGLATKYGPTKAIEAMDALSSAGMNAQQVLDNVKNALTFAQAAKGLSIDESARLIKQSMDVFGVSSEKSSGLLDKMARSADMFALELKDLPLGLANANRGISALHSNADESLITFGLMKGLIPRVASAGTAAGLAMEAMVSPKVRRALQGLGVTVADSTGKFRPFLDIIGDLQPKLAGLSEMKRASFLRETFGADAVQGITAVMTKLDSGIEGVNGKLLHGAEAIAFLRSNMASATGQLDRFAAASASGFSGSMERMKAKVETLKTLMGETFGAAVAPHVDAFGARISNLATDVTKLDANAKKFAVGMTVVGMVGAAAFATMGTAAFPLILTLGLIAGAVFLVKNAIDKNIGGMGDKFRALTKGIQLGAQGLFEMFSQGGLSESLKQEFDKAENEGIGRFVRGVKDTFERVKHFGRELADSFSGFFESESLAKLTTSLSKLGAALGLTGDGAGDAQSKWEAWGKAGRTAGTWLSAALEVASQKITQASDLVNGFMEHWPKIKSHIDPVIDSVKFVAREISNVATKMGLMSPEGTTSSWERFGSFVGAVVARVSSTIATVSTYIKGVTSTISGLLQIVPALLRGNWADAWNGAKKVILGVATTMLEVFGSAILTMAEMIDGMGKMAKVDLGAADFVEKYRTQIRHSINDEMSGTQTEDRVMIDAKETAKRLEKAQAEIAVYESSSSSSSSSDERSTPRVVQLSAEALGPLKDLPLQIANAIRAVSLTVNLERDGDEGRT